MVCLVFAKAELAHNRRGNWVSTGENLEVIQDLKASLNFAIFSCMAKAIAGVNHLLRGKSKYHSVIQPPVESSSCSRKKSKRAWQLILTQSCSLLCQLIFLCLGFPFEICRGYYTNYYKLTPGVKAGTAYLWDFWHYLTIGKRSRWDWYKSPGSVTRDGPGKGLYSSGRTAICTAVLPWLLFFGALHSWAIAFLVLALFHSRNSWSRIICKSTLWFSLPVYQGQCLASKKLWRWGSLDCVSVHTRAQRRRGFRKRQLLGVTSGKISRTWNLSWLKPVVCFLIFCQTWEV